MYKVPVGGLASRVSAWAFALASVANAVTVSFSLDEGTGTRLSAQSSPSPGTSGSNLTWDAERFYINNKPVFLHGAEAHYFRIPRDEWEDRIIKIKNGGINMVSTYFHWGRLEPKQGVWDFTGQNDVREFVSLCRKYGLYVHLRVGPFVNSELDHGGMPKWITSRPDYNRCRLPVKPWVMNYVGRYYAKVFEQLKDFMPAKGGNVILVQLDNEVGFTECALTGGITMADANMYINQLLTLAKAAGFEGPFSSTSWGGAARPPSALPLVGKYPLGCGSLVPVSSLPMYDMFPENPGFPVFAAEHGGGNPRWGWMSARGPAGFSVTQAASGAGAINYFMYSGGKNPGPYLSTTNHWGYFQKFSYDYSAPIGEANQTRDHYHYIRRFGLFLQDYGATIVNGRFTAPTQSGGIFTNQIGFRGVNASGFIYVGPYKQPMTNERAPLSLSVRLKGSTISFPKHSTLDISMNNPIVLPFRLKIDSLNFQYATAQPLARIDRPEGKHLVFWGYDTVEYSLEGLTRASVAYSNKVRFHEEGGNLIAVVNSKDSANLIVINRPGTTPAIIKTFSDSMALYSYRLSGLDQNLFLAQKIIPLSVDAPGAAPKVHFEYTVHSGSSASVTLYPGQRFSGSNYTDHWFRKSKNLTHSQPPALGFTNGTAVIDAASIPESVREYYLQTTPMQNDSTSLWIDNRMVSDEQHWRDEFGVLMPWTIGVKRLVEKYRYLWLLEDSAGMFTIYNKNSFSPIDAGTDSSAGAFLFQQASSGKPSQKWKIITGPDGYSTLKNVHSNKALTVKLSDSSVVQNPDNGGDNQKWKLTFVFDGYFKIINKATGGWLDVSGGSTSNGARIGQSTSPDRKVSVQFKGNAAQYSGSYFLEKSEIDIGPVFSVGGPWKSMTPRKTLSVTARFESGEIRIDGGGHEAVEVVLYALHGSPISKTRVSPGPGGARFTWDALRHVSPGAYILSAKTESGGQGVVRLTKLTEGRTVGNEPTP